MENDSTDKEYERKENKMNQEEQRKLSEMTREGRKGNPRKQRNYTRKVTGQRKYRTRRRKK